MNYLHYYRWLNVVYAIGIILVCWVLPRRVIWRCSISRSISLSFIFQLMYLSAFTKIVNLTSFYISKRNLQPRAKVSDHLYISILCLFHYKVNCFFQNKSKNKYDCKVRQAAKTCSIPCAVCRKMEQNDSVKNKKRSG